MTGTGLTGGTPTAVAPRQAAGALQEQGHGRLRTLAATAVVVAVSAGVLMRFVAFSPMWLDEAQSVAIARLPLVDLPGALRQDGAPVLYYALLHGWMGIFGTGTIAVRALSGLIAVAALPLFYRAGVYLGGTRAVGVVALVLAASNPWLIRYASEARMYSLVVLLVLLGGEALRSLYRRTDLRSTGAVILVTAALLHTHYWTLFLLATVGLLVFGRMLIRRDRGSVLAVTGLVTGGLLFIPWLPTFLYQSRHTGTPWAAMPPLRTIVGVAADWTSIGYLPAFELVLVVTPLIAIGALAVDTTRYGMLLDLRGNPRARLVAISAGMTLALAYLSCRFTGSAFVSRYTAVVVPAVLLLMAVAVGLMPAAARVLVAAALVVAWLGVAAIVEQRPRTQAGTVAAVINRSGRAGDVVVYCPDQVGPATSRLIRVPVRQQLYPTGAGPARVNWVDYAARNQAASPRRFADRVAAAVPPGSSVWLVASSGYRTFGNACLDIHTGLTASLGPATRAVTIDYNVWEHLGLYRWTRKP